MEENSKYPSREYKVLSIPGAGLIKSRKYFSKPDGWLKEQVDFVELTNFLGYRFDARSLFSIWTPKGVIRGGHLEARAKLVSMVRGAAFMVLVDMRPGEGQGKVESFFIGDTKDAWGDSVVIPEGLVVAYAPLSDENLYMQISNKPFNRFDSLTTLNLSDPALGIKWPEGTIPQSLEEEMKILNLKEFIESI